jgi:hypothetical protein
MNTTEDENESFPSSANEWNVEALQAAEAAEPRCLQCDAPVPNVACGRKSPCPYCGFPYPLGDCSDLAEN